MPTVTQRLSTRTEIPSLTYTAKCTTHSKQTFERRFRLNTIAVTRLLPLPLS